MVHIAALLSFFLRFFVLNVIAIGQYRYVMETRFSRDVPWQRMLAPFHLKTLPNVLWVMVRYHITLLLWTLTIVGVYKIYLAGPAVSRAVSKMPVSTRYLGAAALSAAFCADLVYCVPNGFNTGTGVGEEL